MRGILLLLTVNAVDQLGIINHIHTYQKFVQIVVHVIGVLEKKDQRTEIPTEHSRKIMILENPLNSNQVKNPGTQERKV